MSPVTALPVSANNLLSSCPLHLLIYISPLVHIAWVFPQCETSRSTVKANGTQGLSQSGAVQSQESVY